MQTPADTDSMAMAPISRWRRILHWLTAILVVVMIVIGVIMVDADMSTPAAVADNIWRFSVHKTVGVVVFVLTLLRLISMWSGRGFTHSQHSPIESFGARLVQGYFLTALLLMPITGLIIHYYAGSGAPIWGLPAHWLHSDVPDPSQVDSMVGVHHFLAGGMMGALLLHIAGALKHHFVDHDHTLLRMLGRQKTLSRVTATSTRPGKMGNIAGVIGALVLATAGAFLHSHEDHEAATLAEATGDFVSVSDGSTLTVKAVQEGEPFTASFERFQVAVVTDSDNRPASIDVSIDSASFVSGLPSRDDTVVGTDWLDSAAHPVVRFVASTITTAGTDEFPYKGDGTLTIREASAPVVIEFAFIPDTTQPARQRLTGRASFDRSAVDLGRGDFAGADAAGMQIDVEFDVNVEPNN